MAPPPISTLFPYTTLFRSLLRQAGKTFRGDAGELRVRLAALEIGERLIHSGRSEEHTSELQPHSDLVCPLLLQKHNEPPQHAPPPPNHERQPAGGARCAKV